MTILNEVIENIKNSKKIAISFHESVDGDSLGSANALALALRELGKKAYIVCKEKCPKMYSYLPLSNEIDGKTREIAENTDMVIVLDCGNIERLNIDSKLTNRRYKLINIDHHISNDNYGDINYVDTKAAAVGEIIYQLIYLMDVKIDKDMAVSIYTSIISDTGNFKYSNTTANTHLIAGDLVNIGIDFADIYRKLFENKSITRVKFYGEVIQTIKTHCRGKVITIEVSKEMLEKYSKDETDIGDVLLFPYFVETGELIIMFKEIDNGVKISFRSKNYIDVKKLAEKFSGGGHVRASGGYLSGKLEDVKNKVLKEVESYEWNN